MDAAIGGRWNRCVGWSLLVAGFACAAWLDPSSLGEDGAARLAGSPVVAARSGLVVVLAMAFWQLVVAQLPRAERASPLARGGATRLTALGAVIYALGCVLRVWLPAGTRLIPLGSMLCFVGFAATAWETFHQRHPPELRWALLILCFGMALDLGMALFTLAPGRLASAYLGPEDGVGLRMLRLARVAAITLSLLLVLYRDLASRAKARPSAVHWGEIGLLCGATGMPLILGAAALTSLRLKYLLALPADAVFGGTLVAVGLARRHARPLERFGWLLIAASMSVGLLMGTYAFASPLPAPTFLGAYGAFPRRLMRLGHADAILLGLLCIFVARELAGRESRCGGARPERLTLLC